MSQTVSGILVDALEKIGVKHIFGLISDSLNPIGDVVRQSKLNGSASAMRRGARSRHPARQSSPVGLASVADQPAPAAPI